MEDNKIIILYDADCGFCIRCKKFAIRRDVDTIFHFIDIHSENGKKIFAENNMDEDDSTIWVFNQSGVYERSHGVLEIFKYMQRPWKYVYYCKKILPKRFMDFVYDWVSNNRNVLQKNKTCEIDH